MKRNIVLSALDIIRALPLSAATPITPKALTEIILLKVDLERIAYETETARRSIIETAKEGIPDFDARLMKYQESPEENKDFEPDLKIVDERFIPAYTELMDEEVELRRPLLSADTLSAIAEVLPLDSDPVTVGGRNLSPLQLLELTAATIVAV